MLGDRAVHTADTFGELFERTVALVYETAWMEVHDPEVAGRITYDTFVDAWSELDELPIRGAEDWLVDCARDRAVDWLRLYDPERLWDSDATEVVPNAVGVPTIGPMQRARIAKSLERRGIPTRPRPGAMARAARLSSAGEDGGRADAMARSWIGAGAIVLVVCLGVTGLALLKDEPRSQLFEAPRANRSAAGPGSTDSTVHESSSSTDDESTSTSTSSTTSTSTTTTSSTTTTTTRPSTTTTEPVTVPPTDPTTTQPAGPAPTITQFDASSSYTLACIGQRTVSVSWDTENATSARLRQGNGPWNTVSVSGSEQVCTGSGAAWTLEASNANGTDTATANP